MTSESIDEATGLRRLLDRPEIANLAKARGPRNEGGVRGCTT